MMTRRAISTLAAALVLALSVSTCSDATSVDLTQINATGALFGLAYLDNNGNGVLDGSDPPIPTLDVVLTPVRGGTAVMSATTDTAGFFRMSGIPVGSYRISLDAGTLGDSLTAFGGGTAVTLPSGDSIRVDFGVSYPVVTFDEIRSGPAGRRVFTSGIALNPRQNFSDGTVHFQADSSYLRAINVARGNLSTGDSVRLLGRTKLDNGQMVLDNVTPTVLVNTAQIPLPKELGTGPSALGGGDGHLDAALVRLRTAEIFDTASANGNFSFEIDDGSGRVEVVFRSFLQMNSSVIRPDTVVRIREITGLLVPLVDETGAARWLLQPRGGADVLWEWKDVDLSVAVAASDTTVAQGDTVTFSVALFNSPQSVGAGGLQVYDTVPAGFTFLGATATQGSYSSVTGLWAVDSLVAGGSDTLNIRATATTSALGLIVNRARVKNPLKQRETNNGNNLAGVTVFVSVPQPAPPPGPGGR